MNDNANEIFKPLLNNIFHGPPKICPYRCPKCGDLFQYMKRCPDCGCKTVREK